MKILELNLIMQTYLQILIGEINTTWMLPIITASRWIFLPAVSSRPSVAGREIKNAPLPRLPLPLKMFQNRDALPFANLLCLLVLIALHTRLRHMLWLVGISSSSI